MIDTEYFKQRLLEEKSLLEKELGEVGQKNPKNDGDWEAKAGNVEISPSDANDMGDVMEEFETNSAILKQLEIRYSEVKKALEKIENGSYGICEISGKPIEEERLQANPAARTCMEMKDRENELR